MASWPGFRFNAVHLDGHVHDGTVMTSVSLGKFGWEHEPNGSLRAAYGWRIQGTAPNKDLVTYTTGAFDMNKNQR